MFIYRNHQNLTQICIEIFLKRPIPPRYSPNVTHTAMKGRRQDLSPPSVPIPGDDLSCWQACHQGGLRGFMKA